MKRTCESCGNHFTPHRKVPKQMFCRKRKCQKERRRRWQQKKRATDKSYKENQIAAQNEWLKRNPNYWKQYRENHPEYTKKNRAQQKKRNEKRKRQQNAHSFVRLKIAKMDDLIDESSRVSAIYIFIPVDNRHIAKMDYLLVKIRMIAKV